MVDSKALNERRTAVAPGRRNPRLSPLRSLSRRRLRSRGRPSRIRPRSNASRKKSASRRKSWQQQKLEEQKKVQELKEREQAERLEAEKKEAEKQAAAKAAAEKAAADKAAADKKAAEKKKADEAAAAKKAAEEKARVAREAELRRSLEAEERGNAMRNSDEANTMACVRSWRESQRAWIKPPSARAGVTCIVSVSQVPGGEVTAVRVNSCSVDDAALRQSVENAVYSASPLPPPPDPALFERNLELTFAPQ